VQFLDSHILLYSISGDPKDEEKSAIAASVLQSSSLALSVQVLQEFYVQATRMTRAHRLSHDEAQAFIESWLRFPVQEMTVPALRWHPPSVFSSPTGTQPFLKRPAR